MTMTTQGPLHQDSIAHALIGANAEEIRERLSAMSSDQLRRVEGVSEAFERIWDKEVHIVNGKALNPPLLSREQAVAVGRTVRELLPAVEKREQAERDEAEREATRQAEQRRAATLEACAKIARAAVLHEVERDRARAELREQAFAVLVGTIRQCEEALGQDAWDFNGALSRAGNEQAQRELLEALEVDTTAARRALNKLPGYHHAALPVSAPAQPDIVDALLALPSLMNALTVMGQRLAELEHRPR
jgi:hypothetical protein